MRSVEVFKWHPMMPAPTVEVMDATTDREIERLQRQLVRAITVQKRRAERLRAAMLARYGDSAVWVQPPRSGRRETLH